MEVNKDKNIQIANVQLADSKIPVFSLNVVNGKGWTPYGEKNDFAEYLLYLYNKSSKHNAIINGKVIYILGNGIEAKDKENTAANDFLKKANEVESWNEVLKKCATDLEIFGGFALQCVPKYNGGFYYYHVQFQRLRTNKDNSKFWYKKEWVGSNSYALSEEEYTPFNRFKKETGILYFRDFRSGVNIYPLPNYIACANWIDADIQVSKAMLTNAMSGFSGATMVSFYGGASDPTTEAVLTEKVENATTGAEGKKVLVSFNSDPAFKPTVDDLGSSDLSNENLTPVNDLISENIYAGHGVTSPELFGVPTKAGLGVDSGKKLKIAFDIFKNTYANARQKDLVKVVTELAKANGIVSEFEFKDIEPVGLELNLLDFKEMLPKEFVLEKLGFDFAKYGIAVTPQQQPAQVQQVNDTLTNLTGRQRQGLMRIVREFGAGKITKQQAIIELKNGFGFTDEDCNAYLGIDEDPNTPDATQQFAAMTQDEEVQLAVMLNEVGEDANDYDIIESKPFTGFENEKVEFGLLDKIKKLFKPKTETVVRYSYEKRPEATGPSLLPTTRPFCRKMLELNETKMWSRENIQAISERLGYDVFARVGGFWNNNGKIEYHCRHFWKSNIVRKKV